MLEHITEQLAAEIAAHAVTPEQVRAVIHPVIPILYRSADDIAEAEAIQRGEG
jgi:hypothetical protein